MIQIPEIRVDCEHGSSGLWSSKGQNLPYEYAGLPIDLEQRVRHLQNKFNEKAAPYSEFKDDDRLWEWITNQENEVARDIQLFAGTATRVV